jgi:hypothetical protein
MPSFPYHRSFSARGWRPLGTNAFAAAHGMGDFPGLNTLVTLTTPNPTPACSWTDNIWPSQACSLAKGTQQIQSVPARAAAANAAAVAAGENPPYDVAAIQAAADTGSTALAAEVPQLFSTPVSLADLSTWPWWMWAAGGFLLWKSLK